MNFIDDTPVSLSPVQFSKGLLAQLSLLKSQKIGFFTQEEKTAAYAVYEIFDNRVSSIKFGDGFIHCCLTKLGLINYLGLIRGLPIALALSSCSED